MSFNRKTCPHCREKLDQGQRIHDHCVAPWAEAREAKSARKAAKQVADAAKVERAEDRKRKEALKTRRDYINEAQRAFNAFIRARDADKPCICCGQPLGAGEVGGAYDCGHYRSVGSAPHLRFDPRNAHAQRKICNRWGSGRAVDYRLGLIVRIGLEAVEEIESIQAPEKWTIAELVEIREHYKAEMKKLKRATA